MSSLVRAFAEAKPYLVDDISSGKLNEYDKRAIAQFQDQPRASKRQYVSGETMYIWGKQYFLVFKPDNQKNSFEIQNQNIVLSMSAKSTVKQRDAYVKEEYRKILKEEIEKRLPKWETQTGLKCDSWQTKYMVTKWGACSTDKKKLWFNLQLAQKPYACLDYIILHELTHLITRKHDATFIAHMDRHMPNWREIRKELNDSRLDYYEAQDESPLQKLIDQSRYDDIRDAAIAYIQEDHSGDTKRLSVIDMEIENVIHIEQPEDGVIAFDVIASCDVEMPSASRKGYFNERWLKIHCQVINRNIKGRGITRSLCVIQRQLKIRSSIPSSLMHTTRHFLIRSRTQSAVLKHYADIPALLQRHWSRCKKRKSSQISNWQTARLLAKRPYSG